jgi:hypothetical protein
VCSQAVEMSVAGCLIMLEATSCIAHILHCISVRWLHCTHLTAPLITHANRKNPSAKILYITKSYKNTQRMPYSLDHHAMP